MSRLPVLTDTELDAAQERLYEAITGGARAKRPRDFPLTHENGGLQGPFNALLYSPEIGDAVQRLGALLRFESTLAGPVREVAILAVARHWKADYEWYAHARVAAREGVGAAAIAAVKAGTPPEEDDLGLVHRFVTELLETNRVGEEAYAAVLERLGHRGVVELVMLVGYYALLAGALNTFEVPVPGDAEPPFGA